MTNRRLDSAFISCPSSYTITRPFIFPRTTCLIYFTKGITVCCWDRKSTPAREGMPNKIVNGSATQKNSPGPITTLVVVNVELLSALVAMMAAFSVVVPSNDARSVAWACDRVTGEAPLEKAVLGRFPGPGSLSMMQLIRGEADGSVFLGAVVLFRRPVLRMNELGDVGGC